MRVSEEMAVLGNGWIVEWELVMKCLCWVKVELLGGIEELAVQDKVWIVGWE